MQGQNYRVTVVGSSLFAGCAQLTRVWNRQSTTSARSGTRDFHSPLTMPTNSI